MKQSLSVRPGPTQKGSKCQQPAWKSEMQDGKLWERQPKNLEKAAGTAGKFRKKRQGTDYGNHECKRFLF